MLFRRRRKQASSTVGEVSGAAPIVLAFTEEVDLRIGTLGFEHHSWMSVERTRLSYLRAFHELGIDTVSLDGKESTLDQEIDAIFGFSGGKAWKLALDTALPTAICLHGGSVIDYDTLTRYVPRLGGHDVIIGNCRSDLNIVQSLSCDGPITLILRPPIDTRVFAPRSKARARAALDISQTVEVWGFVGRLVPQKNLHHVLESFCRASQDGRDRLLLIVGQYWPDYSILATGQDYKSYVDDIIQAKGCKDRLLYFPSGLSDEDMALLYSSMDVLVHPTSSIDENYGYVPLEAMACGTPVVGCAYGGLKDSIESGTTGYLLPTWLTPSGIRYDRKELLPAIERALSEFVDVKKEACVQRVSNMFGWEAFRTGLGSAVSELRIRPQRRNLQSLDRAPEVDLSLGASPKSLSLDTYRVPISYYVSRLTPTEEEADAFYSFSRWSDDGSNLRSMDPAWSAELDSSSASLAELDYEKPWHPPAARDSVTGNLRFNRLLAAGHLVPRLSESCPPTLEDP